MIDNYRFANIGIKRHPRLGYGHYLAFGIVEGVRVSAMTTNSQIFDFWQYEDGSTKKGISRGWIKHLLARAYDDQNQEEDE